MPVIVIAAMTAILFWSLKPVFVATIGDRATFAEIFVIAGAIALACSLAGAAIMWRDTLKLVRTRAVFYGAANAVTAGFFLALWYYGFYRGLYNSQKADVTIIAFTWPLIAIFAMQIFAPNLARRLSRMELSLVLVAFFGAVAIGLGRLTSLDLTSNSEILFAFLAAFGSGVYLPFSLKALIAFEDIIGSKVKATFFSVSLANAAALAFVLCYFGATGQRLYFYAFDPTVWAICALIGIGTYLLAEMTWNWAFTEFKSLTLSSLVYFSPALSVVYLYVFFDVPVSSLSVFGLVLILFANMTLHGRYQLNNALFSALIGTLFVALCSFFVVPTDTRFLTDLLYFLSGVFAILAGFILSRVSGRRAQEVDVRSDLVRSLLELRNGEQDRDDMIDTLLQLLIEIEFTAILAEKQESAVAFRTGLKQIEPSERLRQTRANFDQWTTFIVTACPLERRQPFGSPEAAASCFWSWCAATTCSARLACSFFQRASCWCSSRSAIMKRAMFRALENSFCGFRRDFRSLDGHFSYHARSSKPVRSAASTASIPSASAIFQEI